MALAVKAKDFQRLIILSREKTSNKFKDGSKWIVQTYSTNMKKRPYTTNAFNAFILGFVGDVICQKVVEKKTEMDWKRTGRFVFFCTYYQGMIDTGVYRFYDRLKLTPIKKSLVDNFLHVPLAYMPAWFLTDGLLSGRTPTEVAMEKKDNYIRTLAACATMWIPYQYLNFRYFPPSMQVLAVNVGCLVWNVVLSFLTHEDHSKSVTTDNTNTPEVKDSVVIKSVETPSSDKISKWNQNAPPNSSSVPQPL